MNGEMLALGFMLVFAGVIILMISLILGVVREGNAEVRGGGVVIVGPIPVIFGTDKSSALVAALVGGILMVLAILLTLLWWWR